MDLKSLSRVSDSSELKHKILIRCTNTNQLSDLNKINPKLDVDRIKDEVKSYKTSKSERRFPMLVDVETGKIETEDSFMGRHSRKGVVEHIVPFVKAKNMKILSGKDYESVLDIQEEYTDL